MEKVNLDIPLVSVFVPSYNHSAFVRQTLDSIRNQSYENIELIIIDDASTDDSVSVINQWIKDAQMPCKFIINETNQGPCKAGNIFLRNATGKYVSVIASDDVMMADKIKVQVSLLENASPKVGVVYSDAFVISADNEQYFSRFIQMHRQFKDIPQGNIFITLLENNFIPIMTALFRRECFDDCGFYDENLIYEDYDMLLRIANKYDFMFSDYISAYYRIHGRNLHLKLQSLVATETEFAILFKHIGKGSESDAIVKRKLMHLLDRMYFFKSVNQKKYLELYYSYFKDDSLVKIALWSGLPYFKMLRIKKIVTRT